MSRADRIVKRSGRKGWKGHTRPTGTSQRLRGLWSTWLRHFRLETTYQKFLVAISK